MGFVLLAVSVVVGIVALGCWIFTLVKAFQSGETLMGVLSICPLIGFIIGWVNASKWNHTQIMLVWTACVVINLVLNVAVNVLLQGQ